MAKGDEKPHGIVEVLDQRLIGRWRQRPGRHRLAVLGSLENLLNALRPSRRQMHICTRKHSMWGQPCDYLRKGDNSRLEWAQEVFACLARSISLHSAGSVGSSKTSCLEMEKRHEESSVSARSPRRHFEELIHGSDQKGRRIKLEADRRASQAVVILRRQGPEKGI